MYKLFYHLKDYLFFNPIRSGGALNSPPPLPHFFAFTHLILELHYCALGTFAFNTVWQKKVLIGGHDLAVRGVSKYKVDMIFNFFLEFNTMLEIVDS